MTYELSEIKKIRKGLGLTQSQLAKKADVSQSLIAKVEAGKLDPTYTKAKKIFDTLQLLEESEAIEISSIMNKKIITVAPTESVKAAVSKMRKYEISQMPVLDKNNVVGLLSERILLEALIGDKGNSVSDVMSEPPPLVSKSTSVDVVSSLLRHYPVVMVAQSGKLIGLITKADLIGALYKR